MTRQADTYTVPQGTPDGQVYFQDVEISPDTVKDGTLRERFDTRAYPKLGVTDLAIVDCALDASPASPQTDATEITLTATITPTEGDVPGGIVAFMDDTTALDTVPVSSRGVAVLKTTLAVGDHPLTAVFNPDGLSLGANSDPLDYTTTAAPVTVTSANPDTVAQGATGDVVITGTGFAAGAEATVSGAGVTVNSTTVDSATQVTVNVTVGGAAATTARDVTVTNTDTGSGTGTGILTVTA